MAAASSPKDYHQPKHFPMNVTVGQSATYYSLIPLCDKENATAVEVTK